MATYLDPSLFLHVGIVLGVLAATIHGLAFAGRANIVGAAHGGSLSVLHLGQGRQRWGGFGRRQRHKENGETGRWKIRQERQEGWGGRD
jgi:hypothetical protein